MLQDLHPSSFQTAPLHCLKTKMGFSVGAAEASKTGVLVVYSRL